MVTGANAEPYRPAAKEDTISREGPGAIQYRDTGSAIATACGHEARYSCTISLEQLPSRRQEKDSKKDLGAVPKGNGIEAKEILNLHDAA